MCQAAGLLGIEREHYDAAFVDAGSDLSPAQPLVDMVQVWLEFGTALFDSVADR